MSNHLSFDDLNDALRLEHYGVKGMRWGVRKRYDAAVDRYHQGSPGGVTTKVKTKSGEELSIVKQKPGPIAMAVLKLTGRKPEDALSAMRIVNSSGKEVGSFQIWKDKEYPRTVRGEWLVIKEREQGKGYSKAVIAGLLKAATQDPSIDYARMQVPTDAAAAKHIYSSLGFKKDKVLAGKDDVGLYSEGIEDWVRDVSSKSVKHSGVSDFDAFLVSVLMHTKEELDRVETVESEQSLAHYGVKGMRWGVRKDRSITGSPNTIAPTKVKVQTVPGRRPITSGGQGQKPSDDAVRTAIALQKARSSGVSALSNKELQDLNTRLNMEQNYSRLVATPTPAHQKALEEGFRFAQTLLANYAKRRLGEVLVKNADRLLKNKLGA